MLVFSALTWEVVSNCYSETVVCVLLDKANE